MQVLNYYKMDKKELDDRIDKIRNWLFDNPKDERYLTAVFALDVALNAKELLEAGIDDFTQLIIDCLT